MAENGFQLPRSSYDEIKNIIVAYGHLKEPGSLQDVAEYGAMSTTTVTRNNGFLISMGIIGSGKKKATTDAGKRLSDALEHEIQPEIARCWQEIIAESDFLQKVLAAVRIRRGMESSALESHIAYTAGEKKSGRVMTGASAVIEILMEAELLVQEDGKLIARDIDLSEVADQDSGVRAEQFVEPNVRPHADDDLRSRNRVEGSRIAINIEIAIACTVDEMDRLGPQIRRLIEQLNEAPHMGRGGETETDQA